VTLKYKLDIASEQTPELTQIPTPSPTIKPGAAKKPTDKK
jgi:hypothetical protein